MGPSEYLGAGLISGTVSCDQGQEFQENCSCGERWSLTPDTRRVIIVSPEKAWRWRVWVEISSPGFEEGPGHRFILSDQSLEIFLERSDRALR